MKEVLYHIFRKLPVILFGSLTIFASIILHAQDDEPGDDQPDTAQVVTEGNNGDINNTMPRKKYLADTAVFRVVPDSVVSRMKHEKDFAYANDPSYWVKKKEVSQKGFWDYVVDFFESRLVKVLFYMLVAALVVFVLYRIIVENDLFIFYSSKRRNRPGEETETAEIDRGNIDQKINEAVYQKNFRAAVRYSYLKTLYALSDKNLIQYHLQATNHEYLDQMNEHKRSREFRFLTQVYEYAWYGGFEMNEQQFGLIYESFKNFHSAIE